MVYAVLMQHVATVNINNNTTTLSRGLESSSKQRIPADAGISSASLMPTERQTNAGVEVAHPTLALQKNFTDQPLTRIYHPRQSASAVMTENFLLSKSILNPSFMHNATQTKIARISNLYKEAPMFKNDIDILA
jgi:hypothetical protein